MLANVESTCLQICSSRTKRCEVLPFWVFALAGLGLSSLLVAAVGSNPHTSPLIVSAANLSGFALLWALRFVVLDQVLFAHARAQ